MGMLINLFGNLKNYLYICIMSLTKRWIEQEKMMGNDPLHEDHEDFVDEDYQYREWCNYSNLPSPDMYDDGEPQDIE